MHNQESGMNRRSFFGAAAATVGVAGFAAANAGVALAATDASQAGRVAMLFDASACVGCHYCEGACLNQNNLPCEVEYDIAALAGTVYPKELLPYEVLAPERAVAPVVEDDRDANRWLRVVQVAAAQKDDKGKVVARAQYMRHSCTHCGRCAEVCPSCALTWEDDGTVTYDETRCIGCKYCYQACPFDIPRFAEPPADKTIRKCTMCASREDKTAAPACVDGCPAKALSYGTWNEMAAKGRGIVERLKAAGFADAVLYGETELGGMGVMSVLPYGAKAAKMPRIR